MIPSEIVNNNKSLKNANDFKALLYKIGFYTEDNLMKIIEYLKTTAVSSYISSYSIYYNDPLFPEIRITFRRSILKRFEEETDCNSITFYTIFNDAMKYIYELNRQKFVDMIGRIEYENIINNKISLLYTIYKIDDSVIVIEP